MSKLRSVQKSPRFFYCCVGFVCLVGLFRGAVAVSWPTLNRKVIAAESRLAGPLSSLRTSMTPLDDDGLSATADLFVSKSGPESAAAGSNVTFDVTVGNVGPDDAFTVALNDPLPAGMTFVSETQNNGPVFNCSNPAVGSGGTITCSIATLAAGASANFSFVMKIPPAALPDTTFTNTATVTSQSFDPNEENDAGSASVTTSGLPSADLVVTKTGPAGALPNSDVAFTLVVNNASQNAAQNVSLSDILPGDMTFVSITQDSGPAFNCASPPVGSGGAVTCTNATLANGTSASFTLGGHIPGNAQPGASYQNSATVTSANDPTSENNTAFATVFISTTDLGIMKSGPNNAAAGGFIVWTIFVSSGGPVSVSNASFNDSLPSGTTFFSLMQNTGPAAVCTLPPVGGTGSVSCTFATLNPGDSAQFTLVTKVNQNVPNGTVISNTATITSGNADPDLSNNNSTAATTVAAPSAAGGIISGRITNANGTPVEGAVISLIGSQTRKTITDSNGNYHFSDVETSGFYTVTPMRANYMFSPANRSFSQLGNATEASFNGSFVSDSSNPVDTPEYFVRQQYVDILGREPDESGFNYWSDRINFCNADPDCQRTRRVDVAAAFFIEVEFQETGSFIYDVYSGALGRPPLFNEYTNDRRQVPGGANLDAQRAAFALGFVQRQEFVAKYQLNTTGESFVDALLQNVAEVSRVDLGSQRQALIAHYDTGNEIQESRAFVLADVATNPAFDQAQYNSAFVLTEYFGYLQRNPDPGGYNHWLNTLNGRRVRNYRGMVCAFITSTEYQRRFSSVVSHADGECGP